MIFYWVFNQSWILLLFETYLLTINLIILLSHTQTIVCTSYIFNWFNKQSEAHDTILFTMSLDMRKMLISISHVTINCLSTLSVYCSQLLNKCHTSRSCLQLNMLTAHQFHMSSIFIRVRWCVSFVTSKASSTLIMNSMLLNFFSLQLTAFYFCIWFIFTHSSSCSVMSRDVRVTLT